MGLFGNIKQDGFGVGLSPSGYYVTLNGDTLGPGDALSLATQLTVLAQAAKEARRMRIGGGNSRTGFLGSRGYPIQKETP